MSFQIPLVIDPLALLLRNDIYVKLHLPDPPPDLHAQVVNVLKNLSVEEKKRFAQNVRSHLAYYQAVEGAVREAV
jgi:hypothetical protein